MIALCALVLIPLISGAQDRHALVIGNGNYMSVDPLPNPANDVELVADALEKVGFKVTLLKNADRRTMDRAAKKFAMDLDDAGRNTVGVFYFAGHGVSYEGENWLLPVGVDITQGADIEYETISANKILNLMEGARNATDIIILDACRNSPFRGFSLSGTRAVTRGMGKMDAPKGSYIAYSTAPGAVAYDGDGSYSPFAEALASEIGTPGITIDVMMINVRNKVEQKTGRLGQEPQTPWSASSMRDTFAFNPAELSGSVVPAQDPSPRPDNQQRPQQSGEVADTRFWTSIENSTDPAEFEIYLKRYPNGQYAELARIRKNRLNKKPDVQPVVKNQPSSSTEPTVAKGGQAQPGGERSTAANNDDDAARLCRQFAGGDPEAFAECMDEYDGFAGGVWMPDDNLPVYGNLPPHLPDSGQVVFRGQTKGYAVSYGIFDTVGQQIGYGQGSIDDASHISVTSYWSNGAILGSGRFHINHPPN
jgi:hypothetical protein